MIALRHDPRIRAIEWRDLTATTVSSRIRELLLSLPWLVLSLLLFEHGWMLSGLSASFLFFLTGLRQAHGAQHYTIGIPRWGQDCLLLVLSMLMLTSLHALQATHLHHHRHALEENDIESATARMPWWRAILRGPWFILMLNREGCRLARPAKRRWIWAEYAAILLYMTMIWQTAWDGPRLFTLSMAAGECMTGFFAVWTVHHDCDPEHQLARTQRGRWKTTLTYHMFYHLEHHLFPAVPTHRLPELAARLDRAVPELRERQVF